jgi:hypothetical protein
VKTESVTDDSSDEPGPYTNMIFVPVQGLLKKSGDDCRFVAVKCMKNNCLCSHYFRFASRLADNGGLLTEVFQGTDIETEW